MSKTNIRVWRRHLRLVFFITLALVLANTNLASAGSDPNRLCRSSIDKVTRKVALLALKLNANCLKSEGKIPGANMACCNTFGLPDAEAVDDCSPPLWDSGSRYPLKLVDGRGKIANSKCSLTEIPRSYPNEDPLFILDPQSDDPSLLRQYRDNAIAVLGEEDLSGRPDDLKCRSTVAKSGFKVVKKTLKLSVKCQRAIDKQTQSPSGPIDPSCLVEDPKVLAKESERIRKDCEEGAAARSSRQVAAGVCAPLPDCALDAFVALAHQVASDVYEPACSASDKCLDSCGTDSDCCDGAVCITPIGRCMPSQCGTCFANDEQCSFSSACMFRSCITPVPGGCEADFPHLCNGKCWSCAPDPPSYDLCCPSTGDPQVCCAPSETCNQSTGTCGSSSSECGQTSPPECGGDCPSGQRCVSGSDSGLCICRLVGVPTG